MRPKLAFASALLATTGFVFLPSASAVDPSASPSASKSSSSTAKASPSAAKATASAQASLSYPPGDSIRSRQYWLTEYGFNKLWSKTTGKGVTVAVIDTGVDGTHQDLTGSVLSGYDASGTSKQKGWEGLGLEPEHGTLAASLIAGHGHDDGVTAAASGYPGKPAGVLGVAPGAKILPVSLEIGTVTSGTKTLNEQIPDAVRWAVDNGADIINLSVGSNTTTWPQGWDSAFTYAEEKGVLIVASAGNRGSGLTQVGAPATMPGVLTVGGVDQSRKDSWSSSSQGISIAVAAPSEGLIAAIPGDGYALWSGTSASAPIVSGLAALIKEEYPDLTSAQIIQRIIESADDAGEDGRDAIYGYGIINPAKALAADTPDDAKSNPLGSMSEWVKVHRKSSASASATVSAAPVHEEGEKIEEAAAPVPHRPAEDSGILPFIVLGGFALWVAIITGGSIYRLKKIPTPRKK